MLKIESGNEALMDGQKDGQKDGQTDGHLYRCILVCLFPYKVPLCVNFATHKGTL